jgi:hypothetical protein
MSEVYDPWNWWFNALADKKAGKRLDMNPDNPHAGFYRQPRKAFYGARRTFRPVAYWPGENGQLNCRLGDEDVTPERGQAIWQSVGNHPVSEEDYRKVAQDSGTWPDEHELVAMMGDNLPPEDDTFESLRDDIEPLATEASRRIKGEPIKDEDEARRLGDLSDTLADLHKRAEEMRKAERKPHDDALKIIQAKWLPLTTAAEVYKNIKYKLLTPWLNKLLEAQKKQAEAAAAAGTPAPAETRPRVSTRGRAISLKTLKRAEIVNYDEVLQFFKESPDVKGLVQDLANRAVRAGVVVPGTNVVEEQQAV